MNVRCADFACTSLWHDVEESDRSIRIFETGPNQTALVHVVAE